MSKMWRSGGNIVARALRQGGSIAEQNSKVITTLLTHDLAPSRPQFRGLETDLTGSYT